MTLKQCPKCKGSLFYTADLKEKFCLQCGFVPPPAALLEYEKRNRVIGASVKELNPTDKALVR